MPSSLANNATISVAVGNYMGKNGTGISASENPKYKKLYQDIVHLIRQGKERVATEVNSTVVLLYWAIGKRINDEVLGDKRADYGNQVIDSVSSELSLQFGKGYSRAALFRMLRFAKLYPDNQIVATLSRQLTWSHIVLLCQIDNDIKRDFYISMSSYTLA